MAGEQHSTVRPRGRPPASELREEAAPEEFRRALADLAGVAWHPRLRIARFPTRPHLAPYGTSVTGDLMLPGVPGLLPPAGREEAPQERATGRFVLLYDPAVPAGWAGPFRVVAFVRARMEPDLAGKADAGGTATRQLSTSLGALAHRGAHAQLELRASWTPLPGAPAAAGGEAPAARGIPEVARHGLAWQQVLCTAAGLPPGPEPTAPPPHRD